MRTIPLAHSDLVAMVDDADYDWLARFRWYARVGRNGSRYASRTVSVPLAAGGRRHVSREMQRDILDPDWRLARSVKSDHRNGDTLDNQRHNLRLSTDVQSNRNRRIFKNSLSGLKGIRFVPERGCYIITCYKDGRRHYGEQQPTIQDAIRERNALAIWLHAEFAWLMVEPGC